jgi:hypothetical protein
VICIYIAFAPEDVLEGKPIAMSSTARCALAAGLSSWARDGARLTRFQSVGFKPVIQLLASQSSFVVQV